MLQQPGSDRAADAIGYEGELIGKSLASALPE
jgi:hypothetical protein